MKAYFLAFILTSLISFTSNANNETINETAYCVEVDHFDGITRNLCDKNNKKFLLLEFFLPTCGACQRNAEHFKTLEEAVKNTTHARLVSLKSLNQTEGFINRNQISTQVSHLNGAEARDHYQITHVPTVIVINENNQIIYRTTGVLNDTSIAAIKNLVK
jgi:thioredoxin-related protein